MKKLAFAKKVERVQVHQEMFWRYTEGDNHSDLDVYRCENEHGC